MADKGIIFSAPMVRALLDARKTQTRRLATFVRPDGGGFHIRGNGGGMLGADDDAVRVYGPDYAPYAPGDRLYVREACTVRGIYSDVVEVGYKAHERASHTEFVEQWPVESAVNADGKRPRVTWPAFKPSIHMPRWASRLWLSVTDVRVQRVQEISRSDEVAEGVTTPGGFMALWNSLHTKPGERWEDSPWIVAVSFEVHRGNIDTVSSDAPENAGARATEPSERGE